MSFWVQKYFEIHRWFSAVDIFHELFEDPMYMQGILISFLDEKILVKVEISLKLILVSIFKVNVHCKNFEIYGK